jgi:hypothetical protein
MADEAEDKNYYPKDIQDLLEDKDYGDIRQPVRHYDGEDFDDEDHSGAPWYDTGERCPDEMENVAIAFRIAFMKAGGEFSMRYEDLAVLFDAEIGLTRNALINILEDLGVFEYNQEESESEGRDVWDKKVANLGVTKDGSVIRDFGHAVEVWKSQLESNDREVLTKLTERVVRGVLTDLKLLEKLGVEGLYESFLSKGDLIDRLVSEFVESITENRSPVNDWKLDGLISEGWPEGARISFDEGGAQLDSSYRVLISVLGGVRDARGSVE